MLEDDDRIAELAMQAPRVLELPTREEQVARIRDTIDAGLLPSRPSTS